MSSVSKKDFIDVLRGMEGTKREQNIAKTAIKKKQVGLVLLNSR